VERGGNYEQELGTASGRPCLKNASIHGKRPSNALMAHPSITCGVIVFKPAAGPAGVRNIVAVVTDHGEPEDEFKVASYHTRAEPKPTSPPDVRIIRTGTTMTITWGPSRGSYDYDIDINLSDGTKVLDVARAPAARGVARHRVAAERECQRVRRAGRRRLGTAGQRQLRGLGFGAAVAVLGEAAPSASPSTIATSWARVCAFILTIPQTGACYRRHMDVVPAWIRGACDRRSGLIAGAGRFSGVDGG
jgi:hypothetical protein